MKKIEIVNGLIDCIEWMAVADKLREGIKFKGNVRFKLYDTENELDKTKKSLMRNKKSDLEKLWFDWLEQIIYPGIYKK